MKDLCDPALIEDTKRRIMRLYPESERLWGKMTPTQTLAHCTSGILMAMGVINPKRASFPANVIGTLLKPLVFGDDKPMRRNSPSSPETSRRTSRPRANAHLFPRQKFAIEQQRIATTFARSSGTRARWTNICIKTRFPSMEIKPLDR